MPAKKKGRVDQEKGSISKMPSNAMWASSALTEKQGGFKATGQI